MNFSNISTIYKKEMKNYFNTPLAYIILIIFLIVSGYFFSYGQTGMFAYNQADMRIIFQVLHIIFVIFIPAISMGLIAEEKSNGTLQLLVTMPIRDFDIILGKYFAALSLIGVYLLLTLRYPMILDAYGNLDWGPVVGGYFGLFFAGAAYLAIGMFASSISKNQVVAFILGVILCFAFQMTDSLPTVFQTGGIFEGIGVGLIIKNVIIILILSALVTVFIHFIAPHISIKKASAIVVLALVIIIGILALAKVFPSLFVYFSINNHFKNIARGVVDTKDILYYLSLVGLFLYLGTYSLSTRKWK